MRREYSSGVLATMFAGFAAAGHWSETRGANVLDSGAPWYDTYETRDGKHVATLNPARNYYPGDASQGSVGQYLLGDATSEVGLKAGATRDFWTAVQPDAGWLNKTIAKGNQLARESLYEDDGEDEDEDEDRDD